MQSHEVRYTGHAPDGSGLQSHSIGGLYPFIIVGFGDDTWGVLTPSGWTFRGCLTVGHAQEVAEALKRQYDARRAH